MKSQFQRYIIQNSYLLPPFKKNIFFVGFYKAAQIKSMLKL